MKLKVKDIVKISKGTLLCGSEETVIESYSKDTRTIQKGDCYLGIKGETFDGNQFYLEAIEKGASSCILDSSLDTLREDVPIIQVDDTVLAIQRIAAYIRSQIDVPLIAVTGSVGKTSTKDMISAVLEEKYKVLKSFGNLNGQIGLPLTLLSYKDEDVIVLEMGMNDFGQIRILSQIAKPTISVITNIGTAHLGKLGSRENILKAKLEILEGMEEDGILVLNRDNDLLQNLKIPNLRVYSCGSLRSYDYSLSDVKVNSTKTEFQVHHNNESVDIHIPFLGEVFAHNSLFSICVGRLLGLSWSEIQKGLEQATLSKNRMEIATIFNHITLLNDTYNSNFEALKSALHTLLGYGLGRKIAVLGDILELDHFSEEIHRKIGKLEEIKELDALILRGENTKFIQEEAIKNGMSDDKVFYFSQNEDLIHFLLTFMNKNDVLLVKASHGMNFQEIIHELKERKEK